MKAIIVNTHEEISALNNAITPLMLSAGQIMERWVDAEQCPINSQTGEIAIITEATGTRREIIEKYIQDNGLVEVEISQDDENWFPKIDIKDGQTN